MTRGQTLASQDMSEITNELMARAAEAKKAGHLAAARDLVIAAVALLRQESARIPLAYALRELGEVERALPGTDGGVGAYREAVAILREEDGGLKLAHTIRHLGDIHRHAGEWAEAENCYHEALDLYRAHREVPPLDLANAFRSAALLKESAGQYSEAIDLWEEAHRLYVSAGITVAVKGTSQRLARLRSQPLAQK